MNTRKISSILLALSLFLFVAGCKKKPPAPPPPPPPPPKEVPPPPPPPKAPSIAEFTAEPSTIERGQSSTLRWSVSDATDISIQPDVGSVSARGNQSVSPRQTMRYTLTAKGPGGAVSERATVTVAEPPPPPPPPPPAKADLATRLAESVQDAYYDYDKSDIREDARATLTRNADALKRIFQDIPDASIVMEGHCDERGSAEYNLGLGDRRASAAREFLIQLGIPGDRLKPLSLGKERPQCTESNEECWQKNRRVHFISAQ